MTCETFQIRHLSIQQQRQQAETKNRSCRHRLLVQLVVTLVANIGADIATAYFFLHSRWLSAKIYL